MSDDLCACGCGQVIFPHDKHPWFKRVPCQQLWQASLAVPQEARDQWIRDQRFMWALIYEAEWSEIAEFYPVTEEQVVRYANDRLTDDAFYGYRFTEEEMDLVLAYLSHRRHASRNFQQPPLPDWIRDLWLLRRRLAGV